jgi:hypothetical protein
MTYGLPVGQFGKPGGQTPKPASLNAARPSAANGTQAAHRGFADAVLGKRMY